MATSREFGGLYRDGLRDGPAMVLEKEFWQQAEGILGLVDAFSALGDERYLDAAETVWSFVERHLVVPELGEWRVLADRQGRAIDSNLGNPWKVAYHTGSSLARVCAAPRRLRSWSVTGHGSAG